MASCSDGTSYRERKALRSDELLHLPFKSENSKFIITNGSKLRSIESSKTFKVEPSSVLSQVKDFLPKMRQAEEALEKDLHMKSTADLDIEDVEDGVPYIEMNLALVEAEGYSTGDSLGESGDSECDDADEVQTQEIDFGHVTEKNFVISKTAKGHVKPIIEDITKERKSKRRTSCKRTKTKKKQR
ncbi:NOP protein chaperone 1-like [Montipora capricornis]|uniref:NOP protein chaperone 1-like n=1 Tax=Montipora capricornis TaxID=246305 RepID=UPI0035F16028